MMWVERGGEGYMGRGHKSERDAFLFSDAWGALRGWLGAHVSCECGCVCMCA